MRALGLLGGVGGPLGGIKECRGVRGVLEGRQGV